MDSLSQEHERLRKKIHAARSLHDVQKTIDLLQSARDDIASGASSASTMMAKLQNPVKKSFDDTMDSLKDTHSALNKYSKALDRFFKDKPLPTSEYEDPLASQSALINRAIAMHFLREGQFSLAASFISESAADIHASAAKSHQEHSLDNPQTVEIREQFATMYHILDELREHRNLLPAIQWAREKSHVLEERGSNLEFELGKLQFVWLFQGGSDTARNVSDESRARAIQYARDAFTNFRGRYLREIQQLLGAMVFCPNLYESPYRQIFYNQSAWENAANSFTREFCSLLGLSADSPLYVAATAGATALPVLLKLQTIMKEKRTEWTTQDELPVEIALPPTYQFHSIFVCPVSKEQTTDQNPPMMMPCGHVIAHDSMVHLSRGTRFKCPYCPVESHSRDARKIVL